MDGLDGLLEALGRLIADRFAQTSQQQTGDLLTGGKDLVGQAVGTLLWGALEVGVRFVFLVMGVATRALMTAFGPQVEFLKGLLFGAPPELTYQLAAVQTTTRIAQGIAFAALPAVVAWTGVGLEFSWFDDKEDTAKRLAAGGVMVGALPWLLELGINVVHALGLGLAGTGATVVPGYDSVLEGVNDSIAVASGGAAVPVFLAGGGVPTAGMLAQRMLDLASNTTLVAGATGLIYALALVFGGVAAWGRILVIDALYVLSPLAALAYMLPYGKGVFKTWGKSFGLALLVVLPAGLVLKFAAEAMASVATGGPLWVALIGAAAVTIYASMVGGACGGVVAFSVVGVTTKIVRRL